MSENHSGAVALGIAKRSALKLSRARGQAISPMIVPLFTLIAFTGALSALGKIPGFDYYNFTAFEFVFVLITAAAFVGAFSSFEILFDYQGGMGNRLMLAAPQHLAILAGYLIVGVVRGVIAIAFIWAAGLIIGMPVRGGPLDIAAMCVIALFVNMATFLYGAGVGLRLQVMPAASLIFIPTFMVMFLTPVFCSRSQLPSGLKAVASVNPLTPPIEAGRDLLANTPAHVALAFATSAGLVLFFGIWAIRGMRAAERKG